MWNIWAMPGLERIEYISENFIIVIMPLNYARAFHLLVYGLALIIYLFKKRHRLSPKSKLFTGSITLIYFISCVVISWLTQFATTWRDFDLYYVIACNIILIIGILLYIDPVFLSDFAQKYLKSAISNKDKKRIKKKLVTAFSEERVFARNDLNLSMLANKIGEKNHHLSQTLSEEMQEGFYSYVNRHRVEYAKELLLQPDYQHYTIEAIGEEAGFNNRVSFYKAFRQITSTTPSAYRKGQQDS
jgi:AraC-like DNA-binding protein